MAEIGEPFELCKIFEKGSLVGIRKHCIDNHVILTFKDRGIQVYNLTDQKLVKSWSVEQQQEITCAAIQDPTTNNFLTVINEVEMCLWANDSLDLQHCKRFMLEKPVQELCVVMEDDHEPVIVYKNGSVEKLSDCTQKEPTKRTAKRFKATVEKDRCTWCEICRQSKKIYIIRLFDEHPSDQNHTLDILCLEQEDGRRLHASYQLQPPEPNARILACTMIKVGLELITFWSDGSLCVSYLSRVLYHSNENKINEQVVSSKVIQKLSPNTFFKESCVSIASVHSSNVCLCGSSQTNNDLKDSVTIWSTKYGTLQATKSISKIREMSSSSVILRQSPGVEHLYCSTGYICVGLPYGVIACPISVEVSSLANSLGKLKAPLQFSGEQYTRPSLLSTPKLAKPGKELWKWCEKLGSEDVAENEFLDKLMNQEKTPTKEEFFLELKRYMNNKMSKETSFSLYTASEVYDNFLNSGHRFSQYFVTCVLQRCLKEDQFWPRDCLELLIVTRSISASESTELIKALLEKNEMDLVFRCFHNITGLPETAIVSCLQHILSEGEQGSQECTSPEPSPMDVDADIDVISNRKCPVEPVTKKYLCTVLGYPMNDVFMQDGLKLLDFKNALRLLKFLHYLLQDCNQLLTFGGDEKEGKLHFTQVLDWTSLVLNAHYTQLILMPGAHEILVSFHQLVQDQVQLYSSLKKLEGFMSHLQQHQPLPRTERVGLYSVEMLEL